MLAKLTSLSLAKKLSIVVIGYALAVAAAFAATKLYIFTTGYIDRVASGGMTAFGDSYFFLAAFAAASLPATGAALFFLRAWRGFWNILAVLAAAFAVTGFIALFVIFNPREVASHPSWLKAWEAASPLRALSAPLVAVAFFVAGIFSPVRWARWALLLVAVSEAAVFGLSMFHWARPF